MSKAVFYAMEHDLGAAKESAHVTQLNGGGKSLEYTPEVFVTVTPDHEVNICSLKGSLLRVLKGHQTAISGLIELSYEHLLSVDESGVVKLWSLLNGELLASINSVAQDIYSISSFANSCHFAVPHEEGVSLWSHDGTQLVLLENVQCFITDIMQLMNGNWLVGCEGCYPGIWRSDGELISDFWFTFQFDRDLIELEDSQLMLRGPEGDLSLFDGEGKLLYCHAPDKTLLTLFDTLLDDSQSAAEFVQRHPSILDYDHAINPTGQPNSVVNGRALLEQQSIDLSDPAQECFWNFFNRPKIAKVRSALSEQVSRAYSGLDTVKDLTQRTSDRIQRHQTYCKRRFRSSVLWLCFAIFSAATGYLFYAQYDFLNMLADVVWSSHFSISRANSIKLAEISGIIMVFAFLLSALNFYGKRRHQSLLYRNQDHQAFLQQLPHVLHYLIDTIKLYRGGILKQVPIIKEPSTFSCAAIKTEIRRRMDDELTQLALRECGFSAAPDSLSQHCKTLIIRDWSLLQTMEKRHPVTEQLRTSSELSFWCSGEDVLFAVQLLHFVFISEQNVHFFATFYDFVTRKHFGSEAHVIDKANIVSITKKDVERPDYELFGIDHIPSAELVISVLTGEEIRMTSMNQTTADAMLASLSNGEESFMIEQLESELKAIKLDSRLNADQRACEIAAIEGQILELQSEALKFNVSSISNTINDQFFSLHQHLRPAT